MGLILLIVISILSLVMWYTTSRTAVIEKDPVVGVAKETSTLMLAVTNLKDSLYRDLSPSKTTHEYLDHLASISTSCERISAYSANSKGLDQAHISRMNQITAMCDDLTKLSSTSSSILSSIQPLLTASTKPRRFETLSPIANRTRNNHKSEVKRAQESIRKIDFKEVDYPFSAGAELQILEQAIDESKGLDYLPALRKFQLQTLGERQQYWVTYADIESLERSLKVQGDGFCQALNSKQTVSECKQP